MKDLLYIFLEGDNDELFFRKIIIPKLEKKYYSIVIYQYAREKKSKIKEFIKSINSMKSEYIFICDFNDSPCNSSKKEKIKNKIRNINLDKIFIVKKEIESWYLAGLSNYNFKKFKIKPLTLTNKISKEQFNNLIPKKFDSRIDFLLETLNLFSIKIAKQRNNSFDYFHKKILTNIY